MFTRETARIACLMALLFGGFMLSRRPNDGDLVLGFRLCLVLGGVIGLFFLGFPGRRSPPEQPQETSHDAVQAQPARPKWMGDPKENRRRLLIILVIFVVLGSGVAVYFLTR
jgi:hypothetical protein